MLASLGYVVLRPEITVNENQIIQKEAVLEEVIRDKERITSIGYDSAPINLWFSSNEELVYEANHSLYGESNYLLDIQALTLEKSASKTTKNQEITLGAGEQLIAMVADKALFSKPLKEGVALVLRGNEDYHITETLALTEAGQACVVLSKDMSKLIYLRTDGKIYTYNFSKDKFARVNREIAPEVFLDSVHLSDDGGYVCVDSLTESLIDRKFDIYGADSGRLYGDEIMGFSPTFSGDFERMYYLYTGDLSTDDTDGKRLGRYDFSRREFDYVDKEGERVIFPTLLPSSDGMSIYYFVGYREGAAFRIDKVKEYKLEDNSVVSHPGLENMLIADDVSVLVMEESLVFKGTDGVTYMYDLLSKELIGLGQLDSFDYMGNRVDYIQKDQGFYVKMANRLYFMNSGEKTLIYEGEGKIEGIAQSPQEDKLALVVKESDERYDLVIVYVD